MYFLSFVLKIVNRLQNEKIIFFQDIFSRLESGARAVLYRRAEFDQERLRALQLAATAARKAFR